MSKGKARRGRLAISLFSGAGGMDIGVGQSGFSTICSIESDPHCAATLKRNDRGKTVWQVDIRALDPNRLMDILGVGRGSLALLHGGPPCQPFSQIGKQGGLRDPRGALVFEMARFAEAFRPAAIIMEQVPNFFRMKAPDDARIVDILRMDFCRLGYDMYANVIDASEHGVAQKRRRAIVVCVPRGQNFCFSLASQADSSPTVGDALHGLPPPSSQDQEPYFPNHVDVTPPRDKERIAYVPEGLWLSKSPNVPADILQNLTRKDTTKFRRLDRSLPAPTLRCGEAPYHPTDNRYITPREAARLQGFPDKHVFLGPIRRRTGIVRDLDQHRQVANAVPPPVARSIAADVKRSLCLS